MMRGIVTPALPFVFRRRLTAVRGGFSLAEIIVVMAIAALGSTIALYSYSNYRKSLSVQSSARKVQAVLSTAKRFAIDSRSPHAVIFDLDAESMWVDSLDASYGMLRPKVIDEEQVADFVLLEELKVGSQTYTTGRQSVVIEPDGRNPYVIVTLRREFDDPSDEESFYSVRLWPSSAEAQIVPRQRL